MGGSAKIEHRRLHGIVVAAGNRHLFTDSSLPSYDEPAATQLTQRVLAFLERIG